MVQNETGPCKDCTKETGRHEACHDSCVRKAAWDLTFEGIKAKQKETDIYDDYMCKKYEKEHRKKDKKHHARKKGY